MYPKDIRPLTSLRFVAALWVLLYYFGSHLGIALRDASGFIAKGYLGVDLFFVLSGFILCHVYLRQIENGGFNYHGFLWNRLARVYPVHLATLGAVIVIWLAALKVGVRFAPTIFELSAIPSNLLLIHAWGTQSTVSWNFPSWSISAEWFAYLSFPIIASIGLRLGRLGRLGALAVVFVIYELMFGISAIQGASFNEMTSSIGALRIVPGFLYGAVLYVLGRDVRLSERSAWMLFATSLSWVCVSTSLRLPDAVTWPALGGTVFALAETSKFPLGSFFSTRTFVYLGEISFGVYMVHMPVDLAYFHILDMVCPHPTGLLVVGLWLGVFGVVIAVAMLSFHCLEHPARVWLRRRDPFAPNASLPLMG